jgi:hypothetical protein
MTDDGRDLTSKDRLLFGAGFVFGVMVTMAVLAVVVATVSSQTGGSLLVSSVMLPVIASIVVAGVVGVGLSYLAFPENRTRVPLSFGDEPDDGAVADRSGDKE